MNAQGELKLDRRHQAEQWREKELIFAQGLINLMEKLARKDACYIAMLKDFAKSHEADGELVQMVQGALMSLRFDQDQAARAASEDI